MPELPQGWESATLRDAALPGREGFIDGDWIEAPYITDAGIRLIQTGNLGVGMFLDKPETRRFISAASYRILNCTSVNPGDVLICRLADPIGRACEVPATVGAAITAVDCTITRVDHSRYDKSFLLHWLNSDHNLKAAADMAAGSTRSRISRSNLGRLPLPCPPPGEQSVIGQILDSLDTTIRQTEAIIEKLKQVKQGLLHDLLARGIDDNCELRPPQSQAPHLYKESPLGWIPADWDVRPLGEIIGHLMDYRGRTPKKMGMDWGGGDILALSANNVQMGGIDTSREAYFGSDRLYARWMTNGHPAKGDVLMTLEAPLGNIAQVPDSRRYILSQRVILIRFDGDTVTNDFAYWQLIGDQFQHAMVKLSTGTTATGIQRAKLVWIPFAVPPLNEQEAIDGRLRALEARLAAERATANKLHLEKSGLLGDLLTGRVRVKPLLD